jgi:hypothetical protein
LHLSTAEAETTTYDEGIEMDEGMNDGEVYAETCGPAGTITVPNVETTSPEEITYTVSV